MSDLQKTNVPLRFGPMAERLLTEYPIDDRDDVIDFCWDAASSCVISTGIFGERPAIRFYHIRTHEETVKPLPKGLVFNSRLFRHQGSICVLAAPRKYAPQKYVIRLSRQMELHTSQPIERDSDFDRKLDAVQTVKRRMVLERVKPALHLYLSDGGSYAGDDAVYTSFAVIVGHPEWTDLRFSDTGKTMVAPALDHMLLSWYQGGVWQQKDFYREFSWRYGDKGEDMLPFVGHVSDQTAVFGICSRYGLSSLYRTVIVPLDGRRPFIRDIYDTLYAPPIRIIA